MRYGAHGSLLHPSHNHGVQRKGLRPSQVFVRLRHAGSGGTDFYVISARVENSAASLF